MSRYGQPWKRVRIHGAVASLQILDPETAFEVEPQLVRRLGDSLSLLAGAPEDVRSKIRERALAESGVTEREASSDPKARSLVTLNSAQLVARMVEQIGGAVARREIDPAWLLEMFETLVLGRLKVRGEIVEDCADWQALGWAPRAKWLAMWTQVSQTFGPLWMRAPYRLRVESKDYGVRSPPGVPIASLWADELASQGRAASSVEVLRTWTPLEMIRVVESSAYKAELSRRQMESTRGGR